LLVHGAQDVSAPAVTAGNGFHLGGAQLDHGELGGDEEAVEQHEEQGKENQTEIGEVGGGGVTRGRVHEGVGWPMIATGWRRRSGFSSDEAGNSRLAVG